MSGVRYVQFGCGLSCPDGWDNFDASPTLRLQRLPLVGALFKREPLPPFPAGVRYGDIVAGLPVAAGTCAAVYSSHVLEHLSLTDLRTALRNCLGMLAPNGIFRAVLPDIEQCVHQYLSNSDSTAAIQLMRSTLLGKEQRSRGLSGALREHLGNSQHLWMWDYKGLAAELSAAGFTDVRRASIGDAGDPAFYAVEEPSRWHRALGIQARRPA